MNDSNKNVSQVPLGQVWVPLRVRVPRLRTTDLIDDYGVSSFQTFTNSY